MSQIKTVLIYLRLYPVVKVLTVISLQSWSHAGSSKGYKSVIKCAFIHIHTTLSLFYLAVRS
jgi:hypothetical protein